MKRNSLPYFVLILALVSPGLRAQQLKAAPRWTYAGEEGPDHWRALDSSYATCNTGQRRSPIDIQDTEKAALDPIQFSYRPAQLKIYR